MKKLLLILLCLPMIGFGQTYVPDDNFEAYLEANGMGNGILNDDYVFTANIDTVTSLIVSNQFISDLTGIEDFTALTTLNCVMNQLTSLDVSQNTALTSLACSDNNLTILDVSQNTALTLLECVINQLTSLDVSANTLLTDLRCYFNQLTSLDVSQNTALTFLDCGYNQITTLDVSQNTALTSFFCWNNQIECLDVSSNTALVVLECSINLLEQLNTKNGNFLNMYVNALSNNLPCVEVENIANAITNWLFESFTSITTDCNYANPCNTTSAIEEHSTNKELLKVTDLLGRETKGTKNEVLFYIYDDGTIEKRIVIN